MTEEVGRIIEIIRANRFRYVDEDELQRGLVQALAARGMIVQREVRLSPRNRVDLLVGRVGVEVKVGGSAASLRRQIARYAASDRLDAIVVVTSRVGHGHGLPAESNGKPVHVVSVAL